jgi:hypothetical protein
MARSSPKPAACSRNHRIRRGRQSPATTSAATREKPLLSNT